MAEDNELEKRAIDELLRETDRARVRAETMGPAGWLKCPLRSTNKRFLLNTLRSTGLQRRTGEPRTGHSTTRGRLRSESPDRNESPDRSRDRSRTPPRDHRSNGGHTDHKHHHRDSRKNKDKKLDRDRDKHYRQRDDRDGRHADGQNTDKDRHRLHE
ncbi:mediator of RNA polymerase II transcription subunit 19a [Stegastes partitus]|uniref:DNA-directed RNA polymerases I and III subunit RPAC2 n=1 Tax=Stegastes partitus TaxID=144197 RepID=A0A3B5B1Z1_9TELE|nr:PREDICTED: DNA-directed RNA polymerases I and III subunit RPAC2 [Stegastes partitus]